MDSYNIEMWRYSNELKRRSDNPVLGHEHRRPAAAILQNVDNRINEWGLRGGPVAPRQPERRRILFLGSSVTLGWGVREEETMTAQLQAMFARDGRQVDVLNAGIGNYNTVRYVERYLTRLHRLNPSDVVVHFFVNDAEVLDAGGGNWALRNSQLAVTLWSIAAAYLRPTGENALVDHYRRVYTPESPGFTAMRNALAGLAEAARSSGTRVFLAMTPDVHNLRDYKFGFIHDIMKGMAGEFGFGYVDLHPPLSGLTPEDLWSAPGDPHPNARGHRIMAEALYPVLAE